MWTGMTQGLSFSLSDLSQITGGSLQGGCGEVIPTGYSIDSRTLDPGELFIALRGENFDGHHFIREAMDKGACGALVAGRSVPCGMPMVVVEDTLKAMVDIARAKRRASKAKVIAVTGSNGKTSVKDMLRQVLGREYNVLYSRKSYNNIIGLSLTLLSLREEHEVAVLELGSNHPGEIAALADIARAGTVVITNIGRAHLGSFGGLDAVRDEKLSILNVSPPPDRAFLNGDDPILKGLESRDIELFFYGFDGDRRIRVTEVTDTPSGQSFVIDGEEYHIPLRGRHNVQNACVCVGVSQSMGVGHSKIRKALAEIELNPMRLERVSCGEVIFLNDAYNANPDSFAAAIEALATEKAPLMGVIAGEMMELGRSASELHYALGALIASKAVDILITMGEHAGDIAEGAVSGGMDPGRVFVERTHALCAERLRKVARRGTAVLVKGSRKSQMEKVIRCFTNYYTP